MSNKFEFNADAFKGVDLESDQSFKNAVAYTKHLKQIEAVKEKQLANAKQQLDIDKARNDICYKSVALDEFGRAIDDIVKCIRNMPHTLSTELNLNPNQTHALQMRINDLLESLSNIEIDLSSTQEIDDTARKDHKAKGGTYKRAKRCK